MTNPWHISEAEFPRKGALSEQLHYLLNYAVIAPSGHNTHVAPWVIRAFDVGSRQAAEHRQLALGSPLLAVLSTPMDTPGAWLATGQALTQVLLRAYADGVAVSFLNEPIEVAELRPQLGNIVGLTDYPQLLLTTGRWSGSAPDATPSRQ